MNNNDIIRGLITKKFKELQSLCDQLRSEEAENGDTSEMALLEEEVLGKLEEYRELCEENFDDSEREQFDTFDMLRTWEDRIRSLANSNEVKDPYGAVKSEIDAKISALGANVIPTEFVTELQSYYDVINSGVSSKLAGIRNGELAISASYGSVLSAIRTADKSTQEIRNVCFPESVESTIEFILPETIKQIGEKLKMVIDALSGVADAISDLYNHVVGEITDVYQAAMAFIRQLKEEFEAMVERCAAFLAEQVEFLKGYAMDMLASMNPCAKALLKTAYKAYDGQIDVPDYAHAFATHKDRLSTTLGGAIP